MSDADKPAGGELAEIQRVMTTDGGRYWSDPGMQARHLALLEVQTGEREAPPVESAAGKELAEIKRILATDGARYWGSPELQARHLELIEQELAGRSEEASERSLSHVPAPALRQIAEVKNAVAAAGTWTEFESSFDGLPDAVHRAIENDLMWDRPSFVTPASQEALDAFSRTTAGSELVREWGSYAAEKLARVQGRLWRIADQLSDADFATARYWLDHMEIREAKAVLNMMAKR